MYMKKFNSILFFYTFYISILFIFFTPHKNIIFFDIDSRLNMDEIIQIMKPSSFKDFIYDFSFGGFWVYGRIFYSIYAVLLKLLSFILVSTANVHILMLINYSFLFFAIWIFSRKLFKENYFLSYLTIVLFLLFEPSSVINFKTTSLEIFILSCIFLLLVNDYSKSKYDLSKFLPVLFGILAGIKFPNIAFFAGYLIANYKLLFQFQKLVKKLIIFLFGIIIAQPMILTPKGFRYYFENIFHHLDYNEGRVAISNWFVTIYKNYGNLFVVITTLIFFLLLISKKINLDKKLNPLLFGAAIQLIAYLFSTGLIRAHYTKMPVVVLLLLFVNSINKFLEQNNFKKNFLYLFLLISIFSAVPNFASFQKEINFAKTRSFEVLYNQYDNLEQVSAMKLVENFAIDLARKKGVKLIWWDQDYNFYYPKSEFHWTSSENPELADYYIKEIWGGQSEFVESSCIDYGGIVVFVNNDLKTSLNEIMKKNQYIFEKKVEFKSETNDFNYTIYSKEQIGIPTDC